MSTYQWLTKNIDTKLETYCQHTYMNFKLILQQSTQNLKNTSILSLAETEIQSVRNHIPNYITGIRDHSHPKITESSPFYDYSYIWGGGACFS